MKRKSRRYIITLEDRRRYTVRVEARSANQATEIAQRIYTTFSPYVDIDPGNTLVVLETQEATDNAGVFRPAGTVG